MLLLSAGAHKQTSILATLPLWLVPSKLFSPLLRRRRRLSSAREAPKPLPSSAAHLSEQLMAGEGESVVAELRLGRAPMGKFGDVSSPSFPRSFSSCLADEAKYKEGKK